MSSVRPITDVWILGRPKIKYYGAYPSGFLERARPLIVGGNPDACVWHMPGGMCKKYNGKHGGITLSGYGKNDLCFDLDYGVNPDYRVDLLNISEWEVIKDLVRIRLYKDVKTLKIPRPDGIIIDLPYTPADADKYSPGSSKLPKLNYVLNHALRIVKPGGHVGVLDYMWPAPKTGKQVAAIAVGTGKNARARWFTVWGS